MYSWDDKAKVPIGNSIVCVQASKQKFLGKAHIKTVDHQFGGGDYNLIPSVYCQLNTNPSKDSFKYEAVNVVVRAEPAEESNIVSHAKDFFSALNSEKFSKSLAASIILTDDASDNSPRLFASQHVLFQLWRKMDCDILGLCCYAPKNSWQNPAERAMSDLSKKLEGVSIDSYTFGKPTTDMTIKEKQELMEKNYESAKQEICKIWMAPYALAQNVPIQLDSEIVAWGKATWSYTPFKREERELPTWIN